MWLLLLVVYLGLGLAHARATVYLIRHGEKPADPADHGLTLDGIRRAQCLRHVFGPESSYEIGHIMAPRVKWNGAHRRSYDTVLPLALDLGLDIDTSCSRNDVECVAETVLSYEGPGNILISWRHKRMREIEMFLGVLEPPEYPSNRFDLIWRTPYPYDNITDIRSEECPGLDFAAELVQQG